LDEYVAIDARRRASREKHYQTQIQELKKVYEEDISEDDGIDNISKLFSLVTSHLLRFKN